MCQNALPKSLRPQQSQPAPAPAPLPIQAIVSAVQNPAPSAKPNVSAATPGSKTSRTSSASSRKRRGKSSLRIELGGSGGGSGLNIAQ